MTEVVKRRGFLCGLTATISGMIARPAVAKADAVPGNAPSRDEIKAELSRILEFLERDSADLSSGDRERDCFAVAITLAWVIGHRDIDNDRPFDAIAYGIRAYLVDYAPAEAES